MLRELTIRNYAIIDSLEIEFAQGLNIITGETGAGKSILLGALGLIAGSRTEVSVIGDTERNCVAEALFEIKDYGLQEFFANNDLEYRPSIRIRRIVSPTGRTRAYVDDTPVTLTVLKELCARLVDVHSQHQTLLLSQSDYQIKLVDAIAQNGTVLGLYRTLFGQIKELEKALRELKAASAENLKRADYLTFQVNQLEEATIRPSELEELEAEQQTLSHATEIAEALNLCAQSLGNEEIGVIITLKAALNALSRTATKHAPTSELHGRIESTYLELRDIATESEAALERIEINPTRMTQVQERLDVIYSLCHKHGVETATQLLELKETLEQELLNINDSQENITTLQTKIEELKAQAQTKALEIRISRQKVVKTIEKHTVEMLVALGIKDAKLLVQITPEESMNANGMDNISFLFSANNGSAPQPIEQVASGGEMSRLMLALKSLVSQKMKLPTIVFDEIDTGVSGVVADKIGQIIEGMGSNMQVLNITHLPQVAAKGDNHFLVYKQDGTHIKRLSRAERIEHIAMMLSGSQITESARKQAESLLKTL